MSHDFLFIFSYKIENKRKWKKIVIHVVVFDPIKILIGWAHHNDPQNLSFVKAINVVGRKMTKNTRKEAKS